MIQKILKIENLGLLQNATPSGAVTLSQTTAIYAENGRGKSTLASAFRACQLGDAGRLSARRTLDTNTPPTVTFRTSAGSNITFAGNSWSGTLPEIVVFDSEFVEHNVYSGFEVRADQRQSLLEFALGEQTVQLKQQLDHLTQDISVQTGKRTQAEKALTGLAAPFTLAQFLGFQPPVDVQKQVDALAKRIEAANNAQTLAARKDPVPIAAVAFDGSKVFEILAITLLDIEEKAEAYVRIHLAKHENEEFEDWISNGQVFLTDNSCPFCAQGISELPLIVAYRSYFNRSYEELKQQVTDVEAQVANGLSDSKILAAFAAAETNTARVEAWKDQLDLRVPHLDQVPLLEAIGELRAHMLALSLKKQNAPLIAVGTESDSDFTVAKLASINGAIETYNAELLGVVATITAYKTKLASENKATLEAEVRRLESARKRHSPAVEALVVEYKAADTERRRLDDSKTAARKKLDTLMSDTLAGLEKDINKLLSTFGAEFSIEQFKPTYVGGGEPRSEYGLKLRNKSVKLGSRADIGTGHGFATTLSEGDKRTLAFAFFIARLKADTKLAGKLIVLDDPVSSLDRNRRHQTVRVLAALAAVCDQLIVLSHDAHFIRDFRDKLADHKTNSIVPTVLTLTRIQNGYSAFAPCEIDDVCSSDYYRHHRLVADYIDGKSTTNSRDIAKSIRPLLEGYYHRRFPGRIPRRLMFGQVIALAAQAQANDPLAYLQPTLQAMRDVNDYAGQFHHDTNPSVDSVSVVDAELLTFAKDALQLIYQNG